MSISGVSTGEGFTRAKKIELQIATSSVPVPYKPLTPLPSMPNPGQVTDTNREDKRWGTSRLNELPP